MFFGEDTSYIVRRLSARLHANPTHLPTPANHFTIDLKLLFINYIMNSTAIQNRTILVEFLLNVLVFLICVLLLLLLLFSDKQLDERAIPTQWMNFLLKFI